MNRLERTHDRDVFQDTEMTQDLFREQLLTNEAGKDTLNRYTDTWTEGSEKAGQRSVDTNSISKDSTRDILTVRHNVRRFTTLRRAHRTGITRIKRSVDCGESRMCRAKFHHPSPKFPVGIEQ